MALAAWATAALHSITAKYTVTEDLRCQDISGLLTEVIARPHHVADAGIEVRSREKCDDNCRNIPANPLDLAVAFAHFVH